MGTRERGKCLPSPDESGVEVSMEVADRLHRLPLCNGLRRCPRTRCHCSIAARALTTGPVCLKWPTVPVRAWCRTLHRVSGKMVFAKPTNMDRSWWRQGAGVECHDVIFAGECEGNTGIKEGFGVLLGGLGALATGWAGLKGFDQLLGKLQRP